MVVSDWSAARTTVATAVAGLDLAMPGPDGPWGADLVQAVLDGVVPESVIDDKVARIMRLARRVGALAAPDGQERPGRGWPPVMAARCRRERQPGPRPADPSQTAAALTAPGPRRARSRRRPVGRGPALLMDPQLVRRAAAASFVLLRNEGAGAPLRRRPHRQHRADRPQRGLPGDPGRGQRDRRAGHGVHPRGGAARRPGGPGHRSRWRRDAAPGRRCPSRWPGRSATR